MALSPLATIPSPNTTLTRADPRQVGVDFAEDDEFANGGAHSTTDFADSLRDAQKVEPDEDLSHDVTIASSEDDAELIGISDGEVNAESEEETSDADSRGENEAASPVIRSISSDASSDELVSQTSLGDGEDSPARGLEPGSRPGAVHASLTESQTATSSVAAEQAQTSPDTNSHAAPAGSSATAAAPALSTTTLAIDASVATAVVAVHAKPAEAGHSPARVNGQSTGAAQIDATEAATLASGASRTVSTNRASVDALPVVPDESSGDSAQNKRTTKPIQPRHATSSMSNSVRDVLNANGDHQRGESAAATNAGGENPSAAKTARSLHDKIAAALDAPREGHAQPAPALARAAQVEQALRLENALASASPMTVDAATPMTVDAATPKLVTASVQTPASLGTSDAASLLGRSALNEDMDAPSSFASQTIRGLTAMVNQRGGSMMLRLDPPELGMLRVQMTIANGNVTAEFSAATQQTQTLLDRSMAALRQSLESQGLTVERLSVSHAASASHSSQSSTRQDDGGGNGAANQQHASANQHDAGGSESRGRRDQSSEQSPAWNRLAARAASFESLLDAGDLFESAPSHARIGVKS